MSLAPAVSPAVAIALVGVKCPVAEQISEPMTFAAAQSTDLNKKRAILGGEMSALERIKAQQSSTEMATEGTLAHASPARKMKPAAVGLRPATSACLPRFSADSRAQAISSSSARLQNNNFLASKRVPITKTAFDSDWDRVRNERLSINARATFGQRSDADLDMVQNVNRWVNKSVSYIEDRDLFGVADYWAGARMTLMLQKGDCEDIALTKMQILAELGVDRGDMYLTIARDTIRRADHALLIVKINGRFVVLDNATDELLDGSASHGYNPVFSFANEQSWIHGY